MMRLRTKIKKSSMQESKGLKCINEHRILWLILWRKDTCYKCIWSRKWKWKAFLTPDLKWTPTSLSIVIENFFMNWRVFVCVCVVHLPFKNYMKPTQIILIHPLLLPSYFNIFLDSISSLDTKIVSSSQAKDNKKSQQL